MKIYLLIFDDGFDRTVERASCDGNKLNQMADEYNGLDVILGPYFVIDIELEDAPPQPK